MTVCVQAKEKNGQCLKNGKLKRTDAVWKVVASVQRLGGLSCIYRPSGRELKSDLLKFYEPFRSNTILATNTH